ncbi:hypothetical protein T484DRAFT_2608045 [Baffinella frigidus]|nr:hypothetical protein T484DRAFT_2608045 [Cryptophyta sp. CCMP2293]
MNNPMYNAILKWSIAQTDTSDANRTPPAPMDPEKKAFLDKVMADMMEDEGKTMRELIEQMQGPEENLLDVERKEEAMEDLLDRIDKIDNAINLHALKGLVPAIKLAATSKHGGVRSRAADIVAVAVKNNEKCAYTLNLKPLTINHKP